MIKNSIGLIGVYFICFYVCLTEEIPAFESVPVPNITLVNSIQYSDIAFTDLPGNGFLIDTGEEILAVTCKHVLWENKQKDMKNICFNGKLKEWKMYVKSDPSRYIILGELINEDVNESIGERNTDRDYLVFTLKENKSGIIPLKLAVKRVISGELLYKTGWSFSTKNGPCQRRTLEAYAYSGPSLLVKNIVQENGAGFSGSPVTNKNGELVGIVSSWKFDVESGNWFEAVCSIDYLRKVLFDYWCKKNKREENIQSFLFYQQEYIRINGATPENSSFLFMNLFFKNWLTSCGIHYSSRDSFNTWCRYLVKTYGIEISTERYIKSLLIFDEWKNDYGNGKKEMIDLEKMLAVEKMPLPDLIEFCDFSVQLSTTGKHEAAIVLLVYAAQKIQNMGQVYAYLGDAYFLKGDFVKAKAAYEQCLQTYPGYPRALEGLSKI